MTERIFTMADQLEFAAHSGDRNPLHVDEILARRLLFGAPAVHGVHVALWALDQYLASNDAPCRLKRIEVSFVHPVLIGDRVTAETVEDSPSRLRMHLITDGRPHTKIRIDFAPLSEDFTPPPIEPGEAASREEEVCQALTFEATAKAKGGIALRALPGGFKRDFPSLCRALPEWQIATLLATTRLVGMHCPGLHSIFSGLSIGFNGARDERSAEPALTYEVAEKDERFSLITLSINAPGAEGTLNAFYRPPPVAQPDFEEIGNLVSPGEFAGQHALVVGGSRGLGEATAKLIAAGGGAVTLTYHKGAADAERVAGQIGEGGGSAKIRKLDVCSGQGEIEKAIAGLEDLSGVFYFASPKISLGRKNRFDAALFRRFADFYVTGVVDLVTAIRKSKPAKLTFYYPSSIFLSEPGSGGFEYCSAKAAGEGLCRELAAAFADIRFECPRLPRLDTDQNASVQPLEVEKPAQVMLGELRRIASRSPAPTTA